MLTDMSRFSRLHYRFAVLLQERLMVGSRQMACPELPDWYWSQCVELRRKLLTARMRRWRGAADEMAHELGRLMRELSRDFSDKALSLGESFRVPEVPSLRDLYAEVQAVFDEFEQSDLSLKKREIWVVTDPITLEFVDLGPFEIRLNLEAIGTLDRRQPYDIRALDPVPANSNSGVTHPHVLGGSLCEGDGKAAIRKAINEGRLSDFFQIVNQILHTYNSESAHAQLSEWSSCHCYDCDASVSSDDTNYCQFCECDFCSDCIQSCESCSSALCDNCSTDCEKCGETVCKTCLKECIRCSSKICPSCSTDRKCPDCHEKESHTDENDESGAESQTSPAAAASGQSEGAFQPDRLVENALPA